MSQIFAQAQALHQRSQYLEAEQAYRQVLAAEPGNAPAWHWLAILYYQQQRGGDALMAVEAALKIAPDAPDALMLKGALLQASGRAYEARDAIASAASLKPGNGEGWYNLGLIESELKNLDAAVAAFDRALALAPGAWPAVFARGEALLELGRHEEAIAAFDRLLAHDPSRVDVWNNKGTALWRLKRFAEAAAVYDKALALEPGNDEALLARGQALCEAGRIE